MKKNYTILLPMMLPIHFGLIKNTLDHYGYKTVLLDTKGPNIVTQGLKYVHNDTCYPALLVIGQFIDALKSGKYDINKTALMITQTGGGCRASNYIHLLRKALVKAGFPKVPVISLNLSGLEKNPGFKLSMGLLKKMIASLVYGDMLMFLKNKVEPYEKEKGQSEALTNKWIGSISEKLNQGKASSLRDLKINLEDIVREFALIETTNAEKIKVGIVGEIYIKYASLGNNDLEEFLKSQDCEINVPGIMGFLLFKVDNRLEDIKLYGGSKVKEAVVRTLFNYLERMEKVFIDALKKGDRFLPPASYKSIKKMVSGVIGYGNKMGEGWLLTAEMLELCKAGYKNIVCAQPFGCLPNHICAKGKIRNISEIEKDANIVCIDYDPGASRVNQENRIKLMLSIAKDNL